MRLGIGIGVSRQGGILFPPESGLQIINVANTTVTPSGSGGYTLTKTGGIAAYDASTTSLNQLGDFELNVYPASTTTYSYIGVDAANTGRDNTNIDFAIFFNEFGNAYLVQNGVIQFGPEPYTTGQQWTLKRVGSTVTVLKAGALLWTSASSDNLPKYFAGVLYTPAMTVRVMLEGSIVPVVATVGALQDRGSTANPLQVAWPAVMADDIALLHVASNSATGTVHSVATPAGWTAVHEGGYGTFTYLRQALFWKRCDGTETGTVLVETNPTTVDDSAGHTFAGVITTARGAIATGTPFEAMSANAGGAASVNMVGNAVTTTGSNRTVLHFGTASDDVLSTAGGGMTEQYDFATPSGTNDAGLKLYSIPQLTAGTVGPVTHTLAASVRSGTIALAMIPQN